MLERDVCIGGGTKRYDVFASSRYCHLLVLVFINFPTHLYKYKHVYVGKCMCRCRFM